MSRLYKIEEGKFGPKLVVTKDWDDSLLSILAKYHCDELEINHAKGFCGYNLSFLAKLPNLKSLVLLAYHLSDISPIHYLHNLRAINISTIGEKCEVDFLQFPLMEDCGLEWRPKAKSVFECRTLKRLWLNKYDGSDTSAFSSLTNLEKLYIASAPVESLNGLAPLTRLDTLGLYHLKKLRSLHGIEHLQLLTELDIDTCKGITSVAEVAVLKNLKNFTIANCGDIESLHPVADLQKLESVYFYESTNIIDGDLWPLKRLSHLQDIRYMNRKHYTHKREEFPQYG